MKAIPFTIRDREISEGRVVLAQQVKSGARAVSACQGEMVKGTWAKKFKFGFLKIQKLVGLEVVWYVIG